MCLKCTKCSTLREIDHNSNGTAANAASHRYHTLADDTIRNDNIIHCVHAPTQLTPCHDCDQTHHGRWWVIIVGPMFDNSLTENSTTKFNRHSKFVAQFPNRITSPQQRTPHHTTPHHHSNTIKSTDFSFVRCLSTLFNLTLSGEKLFVYFAKLAVLRSIRNLCRQTLLLYIGFFCIQHVDLVSFRWQRRWFGGGGGGGDGGTAAFVNIHNDFIMYMSWVCHTKSRKQTYQRHPLYQEQSSKFDNLYDARWDKKKEREENCRNRRVLNL